MVRVGDVNWNLYKSFVAVYDTQSTTRAAKFLSISQSAVSASIKTLEKQTGYKLFNSKKGHKVMEPTRDAELLYKRVKVATDLLSNAPHHIDTETVIKIGIPSSFASVLLIDFFKEFCTKFPNIRFHLFDRHSLDLLRKKKIDLVINLENSLGEHDFKVIDLLDQEGIFIVSKEFATKHNLGKVISQEQFSSLPLIGYSRACVNFKSYIETATGEQIYAFAKSGLGIAYYYSKLFKLLHGKDKNMQIIQVEGIKLPSNKVVCVLDKKRITPAVSVFVDELKKFCLARL